MRVASRCLGVVFLALGLMIVSTGCGGQSLSSLLGMKTELPEDPVKRAAVLGLYTSYHQSTMWEMRDVEIIKVQPMIPTKAFVLEHDPKEVYCVCVSFEARYKVPWTEKDMSPWEPTIRNILVIKTQGEQYLAFRPSGLCPTFCL
ncbi:MAG: hypothetical protein KKB20_21595 [Proteobacteria bacterium]|nr:hypothetical protein [Pseudomonadota bacterium]